MEYFRLDHPPDRLILCHRSNWKGIVDYQEVNEKGLEDLVCATHTSSERHASVLPKSIAKPQGDAMRCIWSAMYGLAKRLDTPDEKLSTQIRSVSDGQLRTSSRAKTKASRKQKGRLTNLVHADGVPAVTAYHESAWWYVSGCNHRALLSKLLSADRQQHAIAERATLMLGVKDFDPAEKERLDHSAIQVVKSTLPRPDAASWFSPWDYPILSSLLGINSAWTSSYSPTSAYPLLNTSSEARYGRIPSFLNSLTAEHGDLQVSR
jgi:hypothetical protein